MIVISGTGFLARQSLRMLWRDWRGGELHLLALALIIAVTSITAVGFFTDRIERGFVQSSAELIAADLVLSSSRDDLYDHIDEARDLGFETATYRTFRSVLLAGDTPQLVEVKAVSDRYPLRGTLRVSETAYGDDVATDTIPAIGEVWIEPRLLRLLDVSPGDEIDLGRSKLRVSRVLRFEPDRAGDLFSMAPRVLMNQADVDATGLLGAGAIVKYRLLIAGDVEKVTRYAERLEAVQQPGERIVTIDEGRPELNTALESARRYLGLAAMISVLLAGVAIATVANRYATRHLSSSAMMRCFGSSQSTIIRLFFMEMMWLAVLASTLGVLLGWLMQSVIADLLDQLVLTELPPPSATAVVLGYVTGLVLMVGFAMPPLLSLKRVPPLLVLRKDLPMTPVASWLIYGGVIVSMSLLMYWQIGEAMMVAIVTVGMFATLLVLALAAWLLIRLLERSRSGVGVAWRFGLSNITRRPVSSTLQVVSFGVGIMVLLLLSVVRGDLIEEWRQSLPPDAPNHFIVNVQSDQVEAVRLELKNMGVLETELYPMVRSRLLAINDEIVDADAYESERAKRLLTREFNLSWRERMQKDNVLVAGDWWAPFDHGRPFISLEIGLAETLRLNIGDRMRFDINGVEKTFTVLNLREVSWDSFNINFFTVVPPGVLEDRPASWITSVYLDEEQRKFLGDLVRAFPNVTIIDVAIIMQRVRSIIDKVSLAIEFIFLFTLLSGLAVLYAAIQANQDERRFESAILRTLGAARKTLWRGLVAEFAALGALAGMLAGASATLLAWVLATRVFQFEYVPDPMVVIIGLFSGVLIVGVAGLAGTYRVLRTPPVVTLRES